VADFTLLDSEGTRAWAAPSALHQRIQLIIGFTSITVNSTFWLCLVFTLLSYVLLFFFGRLLFRPFCFFAVRAGTRALARIAIYIFRFVRPYFLIQA